jgi:hypothetical protein
MRNPRHPPYLYKQNNRCYLLALADVYNLEAFPAMNSAKSLSAVLDRLSHFDQVVHLSLILKANPEGNFIQVVGYHKKPVLRSGPASEEERTSISSGSVFTFLGHSLIRRCILQVSMHSPQN